MRYPQPSGPVRPPGESALGFACEPPAGGASARARVTVIAEGDALSP